MKAARFHQFGGPEVLQYEDVPEPQLRKDQVLIQIKACALNHLDLFIRKGLPGIKLPHINGSDIAGEVAGVGEYIPDLKAGQRVLLAPMTFCGYCVECVAGRQNFCANFSVLGYANDGGDCEYIAVPRASVVPVPEGVQLTFEQAASVPLVFTTAWHMLVGRCAIKPGDTVLVLAAGSGVGIAAIQIAKMFQARVITTAGDKRKIEAARELGADYVINHYQQKISQEVRKGCIDFAIGIGGENFNLPPDSRTRRLFPRLRRESRRDAGSPAAPAGRPVACRGSETSARRPS